MQENVKLCGVFRARGERHGGAAMNTTTLVELTNPSFRQSHINHNEVGTRSRRLRHRMYVCRDVNTNL
ncbi:unnamed protein product [Arctia plantaginis]|uniref:Uncharacterized protein n=1 Tax=Arctia plantaginis TaxID=874455 RepID=A0A8S0Z2U7_ARCPL|nr:unnamed protein product [Arctia plantaginis]